MTPGQIAHDAGRFERKWEHMGESQKADWERIAQSVIPRSEPMTEKEIDALYLAATNQHLRPSDMRLVTLMARAIERHHGITQQAAK